MKHRCPICKKIVTVSPKKQSEVNQLFPFCSQRCKLVDLGTWLNGQYKVTSEPIDAPPDTPADKQ